MVIDEATDRAFDRYRDMLINKGVRAWNSAPPFIFDRYIGGKLMAEGVTIERQTTLEAAAREAA